MNVIGKIQFDFQMQTEQFAQNLYARWDSFFTGNVEAVADEVLKKSPADGKEQIEIDKLELDLGNLPESEFYDQFPLRFREKLEEALTRCLYTDGFQQPAKRVPREKHAVEVLTHFLLHGTLPWTAGDTYKDIRLLFREVVQKDPAGLKAFLHTYGHYTSVRQRLVYQFADPELEQGVRLLQPVESGFICSYVHLLRKKHQQLRSPAIVQSDYRHAVWFVIYAYLLHNRSSFFSRKHFVSQTILQLAARYNLGFDRLLDIITRDLQPFVQSIPIPNDLFHILGQLRGELTERKFKQSYIEGAKLYKAYFSALRQEVSKGITPDSRAELIRIVSRPDSCRLFLRHLTEKEIMGLVPVIVPTDSGFVIEVAQSIDSISRRNPVPEQHAPENGNENAAFSTTVLIPEVNITYLIKWQIIFSVLLTDNNTAFNRKYFVRNVLREIAAHYNLRLLPLLQHLCRDTATLAKTDKNIVAILQNLLRELTVTGKQADGREANHPVSIITIINKIRHETPFTEQQTKLLRRKLGESLFRQKLLNETTENQRVYVLRILFPDNQEHIIGYVRQLDLLSNHSRIAGKPGGDFTQIKWRFLFEALSSLEDKSFNQLDFISSTLRKIAAHYNTTYFDLLHYFHREEISVRLPYRLHHLLDKLFDRETDHWISKVANHGGKPSGFGLAAAFPRRHQPFIGQYVEWLGTLEKIVPATLKNRVDLDAFRQEIIRHCLFKPQSGGFSEENCIRFTLTQLAERLHLSLREVTAFLSKDAFPLRTFGKLAETVQHIRANTPRQLPAFGHLTGKERELADTLLQKQEFVSYAEPVFRLLPPISDFFTREIKTKLPDTQLLGFLLQLSTVYKSLSRNDLMNRFIAWLLKLIPPVRQQLFRHRLEQWSNENKTLHAVLQKTNDRFFTDNPSINIKKQNVMKQEILSEPLQVNNAGMVLFMPYVHLLFRKLNLVDTKNQFCNKEAQQRAAYVIQYAAFGRIDFPEHELVLNKLFVGMDLNEPLPSISDLTQEEKDTARNMVEGLKTNWQKLRNTAVETFQEAFLKRGGKLEEKDDSYLITVEEKAYDLLLSTLPWEFRLLKLPWMEKRVEVKWR